MRNLIVWAVAFSLPAIMLFDSVVAHFVQPFALLADLFPDGNRFVRMAWAAVALTFLFGLIGFVLAARNRKHSRDGIFLFLSSLVQIPAVFAIALHILFAAKFTEIRMPVWAAVVLSTAEIFILAWFLIWRGRPESGSDKTAT